MCNSTLRCQTMVTQMIDPCFVFTATGVLFTGLTHSRTDHLFRHLFLTSGHRSEALSEMTGDRFIDQIDRRSTDKFSVQSITWKIWLTYIFSCQINVTNNTNSTSIVTATSTGDLVFAFTGRYGSSRWFHRSLGRYGTSRHGSNGQLLFSRCIHLVHTWKRNCTPFLWALT